MLVAFLLHASSAVVTFAATPVFNAMGKAGAAFVCLNVGMWLFALGNGTCEAVINPLTASLFPRNKTHWLNILHAGWPLGLILGAVVGLVFKGIGGTIPWEFKLGVFLVPVLMYGVMMFNRPFPKSEAKTAGVSVPNMMGTVGMLGFAVAALLFVPRPAQPARRARPERGAAGWWGTWPPGGHLDGLRRYASSPWAARSSPSSMCCTPWSGTSNSARTVGSRTSPRGC